MQDALAGYLEGVALNRARHSSRYDDLKSGEVFPRDEVEASALGRPQQTGS